MNKSNLKSYAPKARLDFIQAITTRAHLLGISEKGQSAATVRGDIVLVDGREWPAKIAGQREALIDRIKRRGFAQTMDEVAYTWFNRFAALRYMEIHDFLGHGHRVLSSRDGGLPEILRHAGEVTLPGLNAAQVQAMQLAGNQDNELYKLLLVAQCNELSRVMPFLFERIDDETELLLPENLLRTDSVIAKLVAKVPDEDWQDIEVIGWLYQFYISDKKDEVIGKVVKSEDIPAATQLFTPNWIVQYLVQNSVGRLWLMANPTSTLASQWPYYIQPAEQTPEVQAQLRALIQTRIREDGEALNPETITVLDPACGSGHILVVAYDVLKAIYLERGYQLRAIPRLILEKNLYGLDIDDRAAQLAAFALLMKARADDRRLFNDPPKLNVLSLQESKGLDAAELATHLAPFGLQRAPLKALVDTFEHAKTFGSLIQIPAGLKGQLAAMTAGLQQALRDGDLYARQAAKDVLQLAGQALVLGTRFDAVVANPPYLGSSGMDALLRDFAKKKYPDGKSDLFSCFIDRGFSLVKEAGHSAMVTMQSWMFLPSFEPLRARLLHDKTIQTLMQIGFNSFPSLNSKIAQAAAFSTLNKKINDLAGTYINLNHAPPSADKNTVFKDQDLSKRFHISSDEFLRIPGSPIAIGLSDALRASFKAHKSLADVAKPREGLNTTDNERFLRRWWECPFNNINLNSQSAQDANLSGAKWFPCQKGGAYRKWYGNNDYVVNWLKNGRDIKAKVVADYGSVSKRVVNEHLYFREGTSWSSVTSLSISMRYVPAGQIFETAGNMCFFETDHALHQGLALCNSCVVGPLLQVLSPTLSFKPGAVGKLPFAEIESSAVAENSARAVQIAMVDWDSYERSWSFQKLPILPTTCSLEVSLSNSYTDWVNRNRSDIAEMKHLEAENNRLLIEAYQLNGEFDPITPLDQITLTINPDHRYLERLTPDERWSKFRQNTMEECISYAIGCALGRYSLDEPGLIYAHAGNVGFDPSRYEKKFPADAVGIVPISDERWFEDDAASRVREFVRAVWGTDTLEENMAWLAESLGTKGSETADETIRRYLADKFFKDHLQTYKKRPIYWLFSSGKLGAFQALVYLHRYNDGTLARIRSEYLIPLTGKYANRLEMLEREEAAASSAGARTKIKKQIDTLRKKQNELRDYDEKLRHYADMRIALDLDDGVKVNYGKFGDLVALGSSITGGSEE